MAETNPDPNVDKTVAGKESWFNEDARFYKDVYIYDTLYASGSGSFGGNLTVKAESILNN